MPIFSMSFGSCLEKVGETRFRSLAGGRLRQPFQIPGRRVVAVLSSRPKTRCSWNSSNRQTRFSADRKTVGSMLGWAP
jgi:hypothetical protein